MSENNNDILEEQRKAREEFLRLKRMQKGEIPTGPKPSEVAIVPKTFKEKRENFWFQYKWQVIAIAFITIVLAVLITQCANKTEYDLEVMYFSYEPVLEQHTDAVADYLEKFTDDINGDGEVNVLVINCSFNEKGDYQYRNSVLSKVQATIAANEKTLLFITDGKSVEYFNSISDKGFFEGDPYKFDETFYNEVNRLLPEGYSELPEGLQISCRRVSDTLLEGKKDIKLYYDSSHKLLDGIKNSKK